MSELIKKTNFKVTAFVTLAAVAVFLGGWFLATGSLFAQEGGGGGGGGGNPLVITSPTSTSAASLSIDCTGSTPVSGWDYDIRAVYVSVVDNGNYMGWTYAGDSWTILYDPNSNPISSINLYQGMNQLQAYDDDGNVSDTVNVDSSGGGGNMGLAETDGGVLSGTDRRTGVPVCGRKVEITACCLSLINPGSDAFYMQESISGIGVGVNRSGFNQNPLTPTGGCISKHDGCYALSPCLFNVTPPAVNPADFDQGITVQEKNISTGAVVATYGVGCASQREIWVITTSGSPLWMMTTFNVYGGVVVGTIFGTCGPNPCY